MIAFMDVFINYGARQNKMWCDYYLHIMLPQCTYMYVPRERKQDEGEGVWESITGQNNCLCLTHSSQNFHQPHQEGLL